jgi:hypothetical protein
MITSVATAQNCEKKIKKLKIKKKTPRRIKTKAPCWNLLKKSGKKIPI